MNTSVDLWTAQEDDWLRDSLVQGHTFAEIGNSVGRTASAVSSRYYFVRCTWDRETLERIAERRDRSTATNTTTTTTHSSDVPDDGSEFPTSSARANNSSGNTNTLKRSAQQMGTHEPPPAPVATSSRLPFGARQSTPAPATSSTAPFGTHPSSVTSNGSTTTTTTSTSNSSSTLASTPTPFGSISSGSKQSDIQERRTSLSGSLSPLSVAISPPTPSALEDDDCVRSGKHPRSNAPQDYTMFATRPFYLARNSDNASAPNTTHTSTSTTAAHNNQNASTRSDDDDDVDDMNPASSDIVRHIDYLDLARQNTTAAVSVTPEPPTPDPGILTEDDDYEEDDDDSDENESDGEIFIPTTRHASGSVANGLKDAAQVIQLRKRGTKRLTFSKYANRRSSQPIMSVSDRLNSAAQARANASLLSSSSKARAPMPSLAAEDMMRRSALVAYVSLPPLPLVKKNKRRVKKKGNVRPTAEEDTEEINVVDDFDTLATDTNPSTKSAKGSNSKSDSSAKPNDGDITVSCEKDRLSVSIGSNTKEVDVIVTKGDVTMKVQVMRRK
ncbi:hypothetical protein BC940DRAFT_307160 [Gongronella butleri]|nr:hypothetical protein BC940DRAFT_307160 [Gongronella butleri]